MFKWMKGLHIQNKNSDEQYVQMDKGTEYKGHK